MRLHDDILTMDNPEFEKNDISDIHVYSAGIQLSKANLCDK